MTKTVLWVVLVTAAFFTGRKIGLNTPKLVGAHYEAECDYSRLPSCSADQDGHSCMVDAVCNVSRFIVNIQKGPIRLVADVTNPSEVRP